MKNRTIVTQRISIADLGDDTNWKYHIRTKPRTVAACSHPFSVYEVNTKPSQRPTPKPRTHRNDSKQENLPVADGKTINGCFYPNILYYSDRPNTTILPTSARTMQNLNFDSSRVQTSLSWEPKHTLDDAEVFARRLRKNVDVGGENKVRKESSRVMTHSRSQIASTYDFLDGTAGTVWKPSRRLSRQSMHASQLDFENSDVQRAQRSSRDFSKSNLFSADLVRVNKKRHCGSNVATVCSKEVVFRPSVKCKLFEDVRNPITGECLSYAGKKM